MSQGSGGGKAQRPEVFVSLGRRRHLLELIQAAARGLQLNEPEIVRRVLEDHLKDWCDEHLPRDSAASGTGPTELASEKDR